MSGLLLKEYLATLSIDELEFIKGKYCRPDMAIACEKKFGSRLYVGDIDRIIENKLGDFIIGGDAYNQSNSDIGKETQVIPPDSGHHWDDE